MANNHKNILWILIEIIILAAFIIPFWKLNPITCMLYLLAIILAFWKGFIFKRKWVSWMIILGTILSYFAGAYLLPWALGSYRAGDITSAAMIVIIMGYIWLKARSLKAGK